MHETWFINMLMVQGNEEYITLLPNLNINTEFPYFFYQIFVYNILRDVVSRFKLSFWSPALTAERSHSFL
jgi:hypothetical protein